MKTRYCWIIVAIALTLDVRAAEAQCTSTVTPLSVTVPSIGQTSALSVVTGTNCTWTAISNDGWITVTSATGAGIGQVNYTVAANSTGVDRTGTMTVSGKTVTFTQSGSGCPATVTPTSVTVPSIGQTSALSVVTGTNCTWTAVSNDGWITVTSATGAGIGQVNYTIAANSNGDRTGTMTVAGKTVTFTQSGSGCPVTVTPTSVTVPSIGQTSALAVTTGTSCSWTAVSNVSWITVTSATGSGIGQVNYTAAKNTGAARTGTLTVGGQTVTFTQAAGTGSTPPTPPSNLRIIK
jgi:flagellar basal body rod protein FlgF